MTVVEAMVVHFFPFKSCNKTVVRLVSEAPFDVSWPVIEKECLTSAEGGAEMVRAVVATVTVLPVLASSTGAAELNNNAQTTSTAATTISTRFSANIPAHLER